MKNTLEFVVTAIVDNPQDVVIEEQEAEGIDNLTIHVHKDDMGKIIGKEGKIIRAIRNIMKIVAMKNNRRINVIIADNK